MQKVKKILRFLGALKMKYLFSRSIVLVYGEAKIARNVSIRNSKIIINKGSMLSIGNNSRFEGVLFCLKGNADIGEGNIFETKNRGSKLEIVGSGDLNVGNFSRIRSKIWIRFNGKVQIGSYTNINERSELRADELICIGSYNQVSYNVMIWDTNTHNIYPYERRRKLTEEFYPIFGMEQEKPRTSPIYIGDDCWIGQDVTILKGCEIGDKCVIGFRTLLSNKVLENNTTIFNELSTKQFKNDI